MDKFDLDSFNYEDLSKMSIDEQKELANDIRKKIIESVSKNGGHLSSNLGCVDLTIAMLKCFSPYKDDILFDVGHQSYTYKILTGRDISSLRQQSGVSGFQKLGESEADKFESGHTGTALATALGISAAKKLSNDDSYTIVMIGDASIANGISLASLNSLDEKTYGKIIIILNDNNMSISRPKGALSQFLNKVRTSVLYQEGAGKFKKTFNRKGLRWFYVLFRKAKNLTKRIFAYPNFFSSFHCTYLGPIDGHNLEKMEKFFERAKVIEGSVVIHVRTKKGKGYKYSENDESGYWHGTSPFDVSTGKPKNMHEGSISFSHLAGEAVVKKMEKDPKAVLITPAMKKGAHLESAFEKYPSRCFDCGIEEEQAVLLANGFALKGLHPIVSIYSTFMQRSYDELLNDTARMELPILLLVDRVGLTGADGSSHQGIFDMAMSLTIPKVHIYEPYKGDLISKIIDNYDFTIKGPTFIRLERSYEDINASANSELTSFLFNKTDSTSAFIGVGTEGFKLYEKLQNKLDTYCLLTIYPFSDKLVYSLLNYEKLYIYDPTSTKDGFITKLLETLVSKGFKGEVKTYSIEPQFVNHSSKNEQLTSLGLDIETVYKKVMEE